MAAHVLVADDDPHIGRVVAETLRKRGYSVELATDGEHAIECARRRVPDLLLTDVMMPAMDGWTLVRHLRARAELATMPVIFMTALGGEHDRIRGFKLGADDYVIKPFKFDDLVSRIEKSLAAAKRDVQQAAQQLATAGLQGDLSQVGLSTLLVLIEMERKSGVLTLRSAKSRVGEIVLREGKVMDARLQGAAQPTGAACVYQLLTWTSGNFELTARSVDVPDRIQQSTTYLLMEGARLMDEAGVPEASAPDASDDAEAITEWETDDRTPMVVAAQLADLVRRTARESSLPPFGAAMADGSAPVAVPVAAAAPVIAAAVRAPANERDLQTLQVAAIPFDRRRPPWALLALSLAVAGVGAGVPLFAGRTPSGPTDPTLALRSAAEGISVAIARTVGGAQMRAEGIAETPVLRAAIDTDAATLQDLAHTERLFRADVGDTIEVFQIDRGAPTSLVRLPAYAPPVHASIGTQTVLEAEGDSLVVTASVPVAAQNGGKGGVLAVRRPCNLSSAIAALPREVRGATLTGLAGPLVLVPPAADARTQVVTIPIALDHAANLPALALVASVDHSAPTAPAWPGRARTACCVVGGLLLAAFGGLALLRRSAVSRRR